MADHDAALNISCYIRTHNEARNIDRVVKAALLAADEVIVIDAGSSDGTEQIAEAAGATVIYNPWPGNGFQKRIGEDACAHEWLLDIDGDEVITPELAAEIRTLFKNGEPAASVYEIKMIHAPPVGEPWWNFNPSFRRKLYDRRRHRMPEHKIWDQLDIPKKQPVTQLNGVLLHYAFKDVEHVVAKYNGRSTARARDGKRKSLGGLKARLWFGLPVYFLKQFAGRGLWRAGTYGLVFAVLSAYMRWLRDAKMYEMILMEQAQKPPK